MYVINSPNISIMSKCAYVCATILYTCIACVFAIGFVYHAEFLFYLCIYANMVKYNSFLIWTLTFIYGHILLHLLKQKIWPQILLEPVKFVTHITNQFHNLALTCHFETIS